MARPLWMAAGIFCLGLGWLGLLLPLMPGAPFFLLALYCFARGNPAWEAWMLNHPVYGASLRDWRERGAIGRKAKLSAIGSMAVAGAVTAWLVGFPVALFSLAALTAVGVWIWMRPE